MIPNFCNGFSEHGTFQFATSGCACPQRHGRVTRSIVGTIGDVDAYQLPDAKGYTSVQRYLVGEADDIRQRRRDEILGASVADFRAFADALAELTAYGQVVVLGSESDPSS